MKKSKPGNFFLSIPITPATYAHVLNYVDKVVKNKRSGYICVASLHLVVECQKNIKLLEGVRRAEMVLPDGMPLVWFLKLKRDRYVRRVYGPELMKQICQESQRKRYKVFLLGGAKGQSQKLKTRLEEMFPGICIVGVRDTPTRPIPKIQERKVIREINSSGAEIVFIGMGCPHQEMWMVNNIKYLRSSILIGVGAAFNFILGEVKQAPFWIQQIGFEWLFRLWQEPKRLWKRYLEIIVLIPIYLLVSLLRRKNKVRFDY